MRYGQSVWTKIAQKSKHQLSSWNLYLTGFFLKLVSCSHNHVAFFSSLADWDEGSSQPKCLWNAQLIKSGQEGQYPNWIAFVLPNQKRHHGAAVEMPFD